MIAGAKKAPSDSKIEAADPMESDDAENEVEDSEGQEAAIEELDAAFKSGDYKAARKALNAFIDCR